MKKYIVIGFLLAVILTGCADETVVPEKGDFSFELPEGYSISDVADKNCSIVRDEDNAVVGEIELTELKYKDLKDDDAKNIMMYLQNDFHMTNDVEYIAFHWGNEHPIVCVSLKKYGEDDFSHTFFEKASGIYHMWFDMKVMDPEAESQFMTITGVD